MISKLKFSVNTPEKKRLLENFISLSFLQGANYILPLITLPYLVRVLGPEKFGLIAFAQAFIQYFNILTDYGFNLSATREISIHRENKEKIAEIFSSVMIIKFALLILSFIIMTIIVFSFEKFRKDWLVYYLTFGMVVGQVLFPIWFFQGMERMKYITFLNITAKLIFTVAIFIFVHKVSDYFYVPLLNSLGFCIAGILALWIIFRNFNLSFKVPKFITIKYQLKEGWYIFISTVAISLYTISNTFILGLFTNNTVVGYYSAAEKIVKAVQGLLAPLSQTIYPYISKLVKESEEKGLKFIQKVTFIIGGISFLLSLILFFFADLIVKILLGNKYEASIVVLRILAFLPFIIALSNIFGIQTMLTFNYKKAFSKILITASIINIFLAFVLVPLYQHIGISFAVLISEIFVTVSMFSYLQKKGIKVLEGKVV
ncbi:flippase [Desulfurobacterium atlanticum]|uniref:Polysaccharide transporter, PST family n=1 Tax=Desulfurobacterium atlanticum TaxID=240169 RepID=A0A238XQG0_9BACT|nr:polysaccharide transporter, PST family [Desulfurobacterium atlanticum]